MLLKNSGHRERDRIRVSWFLGWQFTQFRAKNKAKVPAVNSAKYFCIFFRNLCRPANRIEENRITSSLAGCSNFLLQLFFVLSADLHSRGSRFFFYIFFFVCHLRLTQANKKLSYINKKKLAQSAAVRLCRRVAKKDPTTAGQINKKWVTQQLLYEEAN